MMFAASIEYLQDATVVEAHRPAHRAYLTTLLEQGRLFASGPYADGSGALIIYEADTVDAAESLLKADPFHAAGVFLQWTLRPWKVIFQRPSEPPNSIRESAKVRWERTDALSNHPMECISGQSPPGELTRHW